MNDFVERLRRERATAILRTPLESAAAPAMEAAIRGGFTIIEFTLTIPKALDLVERFSKRPELVVGVGTVLTVEDVRQAVKAGARFVVSPVVDDAVIQAAADLGVASIPGACTPTEMLRAHRAGAPLVKLFPGVPDAPTFIRQLLGPLPFLKVVPTAGVDATNATAMLDAGAWAVGFVSSLFPPELVAKSDWNGIETRARALRRAVD
jgi:2-dehydro-3-deoxyphosphogluconate aldolase/(4S)-4-hydroxy-2-oxoglutarate aldolase